MSFTAIVSWALFGLILLEAASKIRACRAGRLKGGPARAASSALGLVVMSLFFGWVIRWNEVVPVPLWWVSSALVAVAVGLLAHRAIEVAQPGARPVPAGRDR